MTAQTAADRDQRILDAIISIARVGGPCPTNLELAAMTGTTGATGVLRSLDRLTGDGALVKLGTSRNRRFSVPALGVATGPTDHTADARDKLADLVAEGVPLYTAGKQLGLAGGTIDRLWKRIRDDLGPQAV